MKASLNIGIKKNADSQIEKESSANESHSEIHGKKIPTEEELMPPRKNVA